MEERLSPEEILVVRRGPGANCSSIGSVLDALFLSAVAGGAILVAIAAALDPAAVRAVPPNSETDRPDEKNDAEPR